MMAIHSLLRRVECKLLCGKSLFWRLEGSNPFTTAIVDATSNNQFRHMFLSFGASAQSFHFCRPIVGLNGTYLKSKYQRILPSATAVDALRSLFPVAQDRKSVV